MSKLFTLRDAADPSPRLVAERCVAISLADWQRNRTKHREGKQSEAKVSDQEGHGFEGDSPAGAGRQLVRLAPGA